MTPEIVFYECVAKLFGVKPKTMFPSLTEEEYNEKRASGEIKSDVDFVIIRLKKQGYVVIAIVFNHKEFGAYSDRVRAYWVAMRNCAAISDTKKHTEIKHWFGQVHSAMKVPANFKPKAEHFLTVDDELRSSEIHAIGQRSFAEVADTKHKQAPQTDVGYKLFGKRLCALGDPIHETPLPWPVQASEEQEDFFSAAGLSGREQEAVIMLDALFPPRERFELIDINPSLDRLLHSWLEKEVSGWKESKKEDTPWKSKPATDTGSTKYVVRISDGSQAGGWTTRSLRVVEPYEEFRMQGVDLPDWKPICDPEEIDQRLLDTLSDMVASFGFVVLCDFRCRIKNIC